MSFVAEDGTGVEGANSFVSLADSNTFFTLHRSAATWAAASDTNKQIALIAATRDIQAQFKGLWIGELADDDQGLDWPRDEAYDDDDRLLTGVPQALKDATCELALIALSAELRPARDGDDRVKRETVGPITTEFDTAQPRGKRYPLVDSLLAGLIDGSPGTIKLVRV